MDFIESSSPFPLFCCYTSPGPTLPNNGGLWTKLWHFDVYENATALSAEHVERQSKVFRGRENSGKKLASSMGFVEFVGLQRWGYLNQLDRFLLLRSPDFVGLEGLPRCV